MALRKPHPEKGWGFFSHHSPRKNTMSDWTAGYVADIGYTYGYYPELNPLRVEMAFLYAGLALPQYGTACELGFGQGLGTNLHAAASLTEWHGTDFIPSQAAFAQELGRESGANVHLRDDSFADFCSRSDLPEFDYIGMHGIWSWISDANRQVIVDFLHRKLKVGGVLYISYNTQPGWAGFAPMRHLLVQHANGTQGVGIVNRIGNALDFAEKLIASQPAYAKAHPSIAHRLKTLRDKEPSYVAHEYFNRDWEPMHFSSVSQWLAPAKLSYACSATYTDHIDAIHLSGEQQAILSELQDPVFKETVRDFMCNQSFRRDYWVKGPRQLSSLAQVQALRKVKVILTSPRSDVQLKVKGALGEAYLSEAVYTPLLNLMADHRVHSVAQMALMLGEKIKFTQLLQAMMVLMGMGHVMAVQDEKIITKAQTHCNLLNAHLLEHARSGDELHHLASPVTGGGFALGRFQQLFLLARRETITQPQEMAKFVLDILKNQGQKLFKDGKALENDEENMIELKEQALVFNDKAWPIVQALQIA
jgi:SAM-dependent methyltransferase